MKFIDNSSRNISFSLLKKEKKTSAGDIGSFQCYISDIKVVLNTISTTKMKSWKLSCW